MGKPGEQNTEEFQNQFKYNGPKKNLQRKQMIGQQKMTLIFGIQMDLRMKHLRQKRNLSRRKRLKDKQKMKTIYQNSTITNTIQTKILNH